MDRRSFCSALFASVALPAWATNEHEWPAKPITLLVPGGTGGVVDIRARWLAQRLSAALGQPVVVDNKPGASGNIGMVAGARSAPDGYTLVMVHQGTMCVNTHLMPNAGYAPLKDFIPITRVGFGPLALVVNPKLPVGSVAELLQYMKTRDLNYGSPGFGTPPHLAAELFKLEAGVKATHVPYKGGGAAASDLIAGHIDFSIEGLQVMEPHINEGRVRGLAVTGTRRVPALPELPTLREAGLPNYSYVGWVGLAAPAATPRPIIDKAWRATAQVLLSAEGHEFFARVGAEPGGDSQEAFELLVRDEYEKWGRIVRESAIKAE
jgi:tripartite-type tricarboxylate transporter receptor subunit TctC